MQITYLKKTLTIAILALTFGACKQSIQKIIQPNKVTLDRKWWKEAIVYQVYPRSFKDSNGDGIGDLIGINSKLDYIKSLGVDVVWLNPIYTSPNFDNGYDVSDYKNIMKDFGTMADFDNLLKGMHKRGLKLIMDLVVNHSSEKAEWFKQSRSSRTNKYRNYYHWWPAEKGKPTPRWSFFDVNSDAWQYDKPTNSYYLHYFAKQQPDLNWENPLVRQDVYKIMRFWLDKGIDGFRMDAFQYVAKDTTWPAFPTGYELNIQKYYGNGPHLHDYLKEMNREVLSKYDIMSVSEGAGTTPEGALQFVDPARHELNMAYHFEGMGIGLIGGGESHHMNPKGYNLLEFKKVYSTWETGFEKKGWGTIYLGNHDQPRMVSRWGNDSSAFRETSSEMLSTFILTMGGTPYYYAGDELGMTNIRFNNLKDYRDISVINRAQHLKETGGNMAEFIEANKMMARDNGRTPFQWDSTANAGFTVGKPWLKVNLNYIKINVATENKVSTSPLNYFRKLTRLRKENITLVYGKYKLLDKDNESIYAYTRELNGTRFLILLNFTSKSAKAHTGINLRKASVMIDNCNRLLKGEALQPYEAVVYKL